MNNRGKKTKKGKDSDEEVEEEIESICISASVSPSLLFEHSFLSYQFLLL